MTTRNPIGDFLKLPDHVMDGVGWWLFDIEHEFGSVCVEYTARRPGSHTPEGMYRHNPGWGVSNPCFSISWWSPRGKPEDPDRVAARVGYFLLKTQHKTPREKALAAARSAKAVNFRRLV